MKMIFETPTDSNYTFGYFDRSQFNFDSTKMACVRHELLDRYPDAEDRMSVGFFDLNAPNVGFQRVAETRCFNFQMGSNIFWDINADRIIFNDVSGDRYVSRLVNICNGSESVLPDAIYACSVDLSKKVHIDFRRYDEIRRGYSYGITSVESWDEGPEVCFYVSDNDTRAATILWADIFCESDRKFEHYVEHFQFNNIGNKIAFLARTKKDGMIAAEVYVLNLSTGVLTALISGGRASHMHWINEDELILYGSSGNLLTRARSDYKYFRKLFRFIKPIYRWVVADNSVISKQLTGDGYLILNSEDGNSPKLIFESIRSEDGHPTVFGNKMITDTYSKLLNNHSGYIYACDLSSGTCQELCNIPGSNTLDETPFRCDFHPRFSFDGKMFSIDRFFFDEGCVRRGCAVYAC